MQDSIMPPTRSERAATLNHVITVVIDEDVDGPLVKSLTMNRIADVPTLMSLSFEDINVLSYAADDGVITPIPVGNRGAIRCFCAYFRYRIAIGDPIGDDWTTITMEEFDNFRISSNCSVNGVMVSHSGTSHGTSSGTSPGRPPHLRDALVDFKKGIKRDPSAFRELKDEKQWDNWKLSTIAQA